jgi:predicted N-acetyltransferase YhbS
LIPPELREYAELPDRFAPAPEGSSVAQHDDGRFCVIQGATWASVSAVKVAPDEVEALVEEVRELVAADKHCTWWLGPSSEPADLVEQLRAQGLTTPRDRVARVIALVLTEAPAPSPAGIDVRRVDTFEDFAATREVQWDAFDVPEARRDRMRERIREDYDESMRVGIPLTFVATLDGRPAATAMAIPSERGVFLIAGSTAPWARGRGLYRALVRARWDYAVERGTPALVTQADPATSYPILKRLGFEDVCELERLEDVRQSIGSTSPAS